MKAIITVGLGFGDEGKGSVVDYLCRRYNSKLVVRYCGGSQAGHNVVLPDGRKHCFSQFGAGTFAGVRTYLGKHVIVNPITLRNEAKHLIECGISNPRILLSIHSQALVTTPYHQYVNRKKENYKKEVAVNIKGVKNDLRHGSCGQGIGETRNYWLKYNKDSIFVKDLIGSKNELCDKLELVRQRLLADNSIFTNYSMHYNQMLSKGNYQDSVFNLSVKEVANDLIKDLYFHQYDWLPVPLSEAVGPIIFEGAQGVLLDEWYGFHPYTTWSTVTPRFALEMCEEYGIDETYTLGITRSYATRHGNGPFPCKSLDLDLTDDNNPSNEWQGDMRFGKLNMELMKYSIESCGKVDGIAVTCLDQVFNHDIMELPSVVLKSYSSTYENKTDIGLPWDEIKRGL